MSSHGGGGGGGGAILALVLLVAFVALVSIAVVSFPPSFSPVSSTGRGNSTSTARGFQPPPGLIPVSRVPAASGKPSSGRTPTPASSVAQPKLTPAPAPTSTAPQISPQEIPQGFTLQQLSPYFRKVRLTSLSVGGFGLIGQVGFYTSLGQSEQVDVTGWRVQGNRGALFVPKAVQVYDAAGLTPETDIVLKSGDSLSLYSGGQSAVGKNLRMNKCLGYLPTANNFKPSISRSCPSIDRTELVNFSGQCQNYIQSLGSCTIPDFGDVRIPLPDYACRAFLEKLNYRGCVERYGKDKDFLQSQVYGWIGAVPFDQYHDKIRLFDGKGLLVDTYDY